MRLFRHFLPSLHKTVTFICYSILTLNISKQRKVCAMWTNIITKGKENDRELPVRLLGELQDVAEQLTYQAHLDSPEDDFPIGISLVEDTINRAFTGGYAVTDYLHGASPYYVYEKLKDLCSTLGEKGVTAPTREEYEILRLALDTLPKTELELEDVLKVAKTSFMQKINNMPLDSSEKDGTMILFDEVADAVRNHAKNELDIFYSAGRSPGS